MNSDKKLLIKNNLENIVKMIVMKINFILKMKYYQKRFLNVKVLAILMLIFMVNINYQNYA